MIPSYTIDTWEEAERLIPAPTIGIDWGIGPDFAVERPVLVVDRSIMATLYPRLRKS